MKLYLTSITAKEGDIKEFSFQPPESFTWQAGQYMHYVLPHDADDRGIERWFTISSAPSEKEVRITTRINSERSSSFKAALQNLAVGDSIEADGPEGDFVLGNTSRHYLFIIGGIGITPVRSMLVDAAVNGIDVHATVLYANRNEDIPFRSELDELSAKNPELRIDYVTEPARIDEVKLRETLAAIENPLIYISGPEPMVKALAETVKTLGVSEENLKIDDFPGYEGI